MLNVYMRPRLTPREWSRGNASDIDGQAERPKRAGVNESMLSEFRSDPVRLREDSHPLLGPSQPPRFCLTYSFSGNFGACCGNRIRFELKRLVE